jgi:hypothetical protein
MASTIASGIISLEQPDIFCRYNGPPKPKPNQSQKRDQAPRRKVDPSPDISFIGIDDILHSDLAGLGPAPEFGGEAVEGGSRGTCESAMHMLFRQLGILTCQSTRSHNN